MSMHLVGPYLTTTKYSSKKKTASKSKRLAESTAKHEQWLRERGLHPEQRNLQRAFKGKHQNELPDYSNGRNSAELSNGIGNGYKTGIMANLHKEKPEVQREIKQWANRVAPLYNKGGLQVITDGTDITQIGSKSRRG
jgi:hypothetical protein